MTPIELAKRFHDTYEELAPSFGYETRQETKVFDPETANGRLMIATSARIIAALDPAWLARIAALEAQVAAADRLAEVMDDTSQEALMAEIQEGYGPAIGDGPAFHRGYDAALIRVRTALAAYRASRGGDK